MHWSRHTKHAAFGIGLAAIATGLSWLVAEQSSQLFVDSFGTISGFILGWMIARMWDDQSPLKNRSPLFVDYPDGRIAYYPTGGRRGYWINAEQEQSVRARSVRTTRLVVTAAVLFLVANLALLPGTSRLTQFLPHGYEIAVAIFGMLPVFVILLLSRLLARRPIAGLRPAPERSHKEVRKLLAVATLLWTSVVALASAVVLTIVLGVSLVTLTRYRQSDIDLVFFWAMFAALILLTAWTAARLVAKLAARRG